ncbi:MAG TPA: M56 family metallopeptidase, partial [Steroidobacteraceae bacterium]|nr:M56 family metallopeptidase [Steroidobacteraceae bacterium]
MTDTIVDWLSTYALHSTVLLCAVYALERLRILVEVDVRESAWRIAALAPIITAALQVALMIAKPHDTSSSVMQSADESISHTALPASSSTLWPDSASGPIPRTTLPAVERPDSLMGLEASAPLQIPLPMPKQIVAIVWLLGGGLALGALAWQFSALRRRVDAFALCRDGGVVAEALELAARAKVRIDAVKQFEGTSTALVVPPATLCIPTWAVGDLDPAHRRAMIAHEVAHLARRDPWWRLVHRAVARILFFQPMNWVALKRLDELSEFSCDEWAAKAADRVALMECLIACGERIVARQPALAASMARHRSTLIERIQILFTQAPRRRLRVYLARGSLLALCFGALGLPMLAFEETAVAAPQIESASSAASHSHSWSLDDARSQGVQIVRRSKFGGLWGPRVTTLQVNLEGATLGARIEGDVKFAVTEDSVAAIEGSLV